MTNTTPATGDNSENRLDAVKRDMGMLGRAEALGQVSRASAFLKLADYAFNGTIGVSDAEVAYDTYLAGKSRVGSKNPLAIDQSSGSRNAQVSKFRVSIKVGALPAIDGRDTLHRTVAMVEELVKSGTKAQSPLDALCTVGRAQINAPDALLTDDEIRTLVAKAAPASKELLDKLIDEYKRLHRLHGEANLPSTGEAVDSYANAIVECGGEIPAVTKEEKKHAAFMAQAAAFGFTIAPAEAA